MLCFVFAALVVLLDQLFKRWVVITLMVGEETVVVNGLLNLLHVENSGAAFSILPDHRWLLAAISFVAALVLIAILLRYNEGFWGTLGLASVLGGAVGNLIDRVFHGYVVDMFRFPFMEFAIFNIADIFITLGMITFCIFFIITSFRSGGEKGEYEDSEQDEYENAAIEQYDRKNYQQEPQVHQTPEEVDYNKLFYEDQQAEKYPELDFDPPQQEYYEPVPEHFTPPQELFDSAPSQTSHYGAAAQQDYYGYSQGEPAYGEQVSDPVYYENPQDQSAYYGAAPLRRVYDESEMEPQGGETPTLEALNALASELSADDLLADYNIDDLLREYGFEDDNN